MDSEKLSYIAGVLHSGGYFILNKGVELNEVNVVGSKL